MMKTQNHFQTFLFAFLCLAVFPLASLGQTSSFPNFLVGDWKVEDKESYEHWDKLNNVMLKGFSYSKQQNMPKVMEYMELKQQDQAVHLLVNIPEQHNGETFSFKQRIDGKQWIYENPTNDFPKIVIYEQLNADTLQIYLRNEEQEVSYKLMRVKAAQ